MPSKADFQALADWCGQPSPNPLLQRVVGAHLIATTPHAEAEVPSEHYEGSLFFKTPRLSSHYPEHFTGWLRADVLGSRSAVKVRMRVGDTWAAADFDWTWTGTSDDIEVSSVEPDASGGGMVDVLFGENSSQGRLKLFLFPTLEFVWPGETSDG